MSNNKNNLVFVNTGFGGDCGAFVVYPVVVIGR